MKKLIKFQFALSILIFLISCSDNPSKEEKLVELKDYNSHIILDLRYATTNNFLNEAVYPEARCFVRETVAIKLDSIQQELETLGLGLKIFDGYRPLSVTKKMWEIVPDKRYVADPKTGSRHNRGAAVDVTLVDSLGNDLPMPTEFDAFNERAWHTFNDLPDDIKKNRSLLKNMMEKYGFVAIKTEWWHYDLKNYQDYSILDLSFEEIERENQK